MTEMEMHYAGEIIEDYAGEIIKVSFKKYKGIEDISREEMINTFWKPLLPSVDYSLQCDGDSEPMTDWDYQDEEQPYV